MPINSHHPDYDKMFSKWERCEDTSAGRDAILQAKDKYLPRLKDQSEEDYTSYLVRATFYNATWRTISGLVGMVLRKPPVITVPDLVVPMLDDITMSGVPINAFAQTILEEAIEEGRVGILVDCPPVYAEGVNTPTLADSIAQNIRPTMQMYDAKSIINWRTGLVNNKNVLTLIVLEESEEVIVDDWTSKTEKRWRELALVEGVYRVRRFKREADKDIQIGNDIFPKLGGKTMKHIPFQFIGVDDITPDIDEPPLIDLVDMNLAHYRVSADYEHGCHFTGLPTPVVSGYVNEDKSEKLYIGSSHAWVFPDPSAKASYLEFSGDGLKSLVENLQNKEKQMAVLGARMLEQKLRGVESADTASIHRKGEESMLAAVAQTVSMGVVNALRWFVEWAGADNSNIAFDFNKDFYPVPMTAQMLTALLSGWQMGAPGFSDQELFAKFQVADMIATDATLEEEQARIADSAAKMNALNTMGASIN